MTRYEAGEGEEWRGFYNEHRGGSGAVIMVTVFDGGLPNRMGVFSCIERAEEWAAKLGDDVQIVFSPHVVDEPYFGNVPKN